MTNRPNRTNVERTIWGRCAVCDRCQIYVNGPEMGRCIYGGTFNGYQTLYCDDADDRRRPARGVADVENAAWALSDDQQDHTVSRPALWLD